MRSLFILLYGIVAYILFLTSFLYAIGFVGAIFVPKNVDSGIGASLPVAIAIDLLLLSVFALQHSVMARRGFKRAWTRLVPPAIERSTYVILASLALFLLYWQWQPVPAVVWVVHDPYATLLLRALFWSGWILVVLSSFLIDHFEMFGLRQAVLAASGQPLPVPAFKIPLFYRNLRHPLYLGFIIAFWATPMMTAGHLLFAGVATVYIMIGIRLEERDLLALFGESYRRYRERTPMLLPWRRPGVRSPATRFKPR